MRRETYLKDLARIRDQVNQLLENRLTSPGYETSAPGLWVPVVDVMEDESSYFVCTELPGVNPEDIQLQATGTRLEISGHRQSGEEGGNFLCMECTYGRFRCTVDLDGEIDLDGVAKSLRRGVLTVTIPKESVQRAATTASNGGA